MSCRVMTSSFTKSCFAQRLREQISSAPRWVGSVLRISLHVAIASSCWPRLRCPLATLSRRAWERRELSGRIRTQGDCTSLKGIWHGVPNTLVILLVPLRGSQKLVDLRAGTWVEGSNFNSELERDLLRSVWSSNARGWGLRANFVGPLGCGFSRRSWEVDHEHAVWVAAHQGTVRNVWSNS